MKVAIRTNHIDAVSPWQGSANVPSKRGAGDDRQPSSEHRQGVLSACPIPTGDLSILRMSA